MGCHLVAQLEDGLPVLRIEDAQTGQVLLNWSYQEASSLSDKKQLQDLFRELLLLTVQRGAGVTRRYSIRPSVTARG